MSDMELIREYALRKSEQAFAEIVSRHINLVYSVALRQVRDRHLAEEITQTVFIILARKAATLGPNIILSGWLCRTARFASTKALIARARRQNRENQSFMESTLHNEPDADAETWSEIEPVLDAAMAQLARKDHDALVVRFFEKRSFKEVATVIGATEASAKMRVNRALEKLRMIFAKRGITLTTAIIASAVSAHSVQAAPAGLASSVTFAAVKGTAVTSSTITLINSTLKLMAWSKMKTAAIISAAAILTVGTATIALQSKSTGADQPVAAKPKGHVAYASPEATMQTLIAALKAADTKKFEEGCTPERAENFRMRNAMKTDEELKHEALGQAKAFSSFKILERKVISDDEIQMRVVATGDTSEAQMGDRDSVIRMRKIAGDWKFDGPIR